MVTNDPLTSFIRATFRSVWSLELLLHLSRHRDRSWSRDELVAALRGSDLVVAHSIESLLAAGLISIDLEHRVRYSPASADGERLVEATEAAYAKSPDAIRRLIISSVSGGLAAFADAFRLRKD